MSHFVLFIEKKICIGVIIGTKSVVSREDLKKLIFLRNSTMQCSNSKTKIFGKNEGNVFQAFELALIKKLYSISTYLFKSDKAGYEQT